MFYVGQKVVCVSAPPCNCGDCSGNNPAKVGEVYTVIKVTPWPNCLGLLFNEIPVPDPHAGYVSINFRPLIQKSTDTGMAILLEILARETIADKPPVRRKVEIG